MKKLLLILLCLPLLFNSCSKKDNISIKQEQMITWELNFGDDFWDAARSVIQSIDSSYIVSHSASTISGENKSYLSKVSYYGDVVWHKVILMRHSMGGDNLLQTNNGDLVICGQTEIGYDVYLSKTDIDGTLIWENTFEALNNQMSLNARSIIETLDGGYLICANLAGFDGISTETHLIKTDFNGTLEWEQVITNSFALRLPSLALSANGGYIICGNKNNGNDFDIHLVKTDDNGNQQWTQTFGGISYNEAYDIKSTLDGGYIICGETSSIGFGEEDAFLIKTDNLGNKEWENTYGGSIEDGGQSVIQTNDGGFALCGFTTSLSTTVGEGDVYLVKTNNNGAEQWYKTYGGIREDWAHSIIQTDDGGFLMCGGTYSYGDIDGITDVYLLKIDANGEINN